MSYGNNPLSLGEKSGRRVLFDTGSSYTYFPEQAYSELVASVSIIIYSQIERLETVFRKHFHGPTNYSMLIDEA